jgi:nucleotide-binding universal stress UspA family protein
VGWDELGDPGHPTQPALITGQRTGSTGCRACRRACAPPSAHTDRAGIFLAAHRLAPTLPMARQLEDPYASLVLLDAQRLASAKGATVTPVLVAGEAAQAVVAVAGRLVADLLVVGAKPRRGPMAALGKTRRWIQAHAPCPVLVVPAGEISPMPRLSEQILVASGARNEPAACSCGDHCRACRCYEPV